jgi:alpha-L-fucosidase
MGEWMKYNSRSIYGCTQAPEEFEAPEHSILTYNPETNRLIYSPD